MPHATPHLPLNSRPAALPRAAALLCASLALSSFLATAGTTEIDNEPLVTRPSVQAKPNLMVILDDSGSMDWDWMPDDLGYYYGDNTGYAGGYTPYSNWYGYRSAQCNGLAYDPSYHYTPPSKYNSKPAAEKLYDNASYPLAYKDGYAGGSTTNLSGHFYYIYKGSQPKMGWRYDTNGVINNAFAQECRLTVGSDPNEELFKRVNVSNLTDAEKTNYANWYSYYRKRYLLMRTAMGNALTALDDSYRVGFSTIRETAFVDGGSNRFLSVRDFGGGANGQADKLYQSLYQKLPSGGTPLRSALANTGRYFANKHSGQADPMQYSCQRNYALLTTDGYWNGGNGMQLDGSTEIHQHDALEDRPMRDDSVLLTQTQTLYSATATRTLTETFNRQRNVVYTRSKKSGTTTYTETRTCVQGGAEATPINQQGQASYNKVEITSQATNYTNIQYDNWQNTSTGTTTYTEGSVPSTNSGTCSSSYSPSTPSNTGWGSWSAASFGSWVTTSSAGASTSNLSPTSRSDSAFAPATPGVSSVVQAGTGASKTLADVAQYYWATDLRSPALGNCQSSESGVARDVCTNIVSNGQGAVPTHQHLNTYTIGLGVSGTLLYDKRYLTQTSGDYVDLKSGQRNWPQPGDDLRAVNIDDLWHAAVNGRGQYYSALDASSLKDAISGVISNIQQTPGASSSAATSSIELVAGENNRVYRAGYTTGVWTGDVIAYRLSGSTAEISSTVEWSAQTLLEAKAIGTRQVYFNRQGVLTSFTHDNLSSAQQTYFNNLCDKPVVASQCADLKANELLLANNGENLVNYLRGVRTYESATNASDVDISPLYRTRERLLGDIINGAPVYVSKPPFSYADSGYNQFKTSATRGATIYVGANDGMLHAFDAQTGNERWAFIPSAVMPNLYKLADKQYGVKHQYFVDGAPVVGDIQVTEVVDGQEKAAWKTILVGGLNKGGKAYYALDITNPESPAMLWEFTHANLGLSFGNPVITKDQSGTWVVAFSSGYNNESGDGKGRLFIVNAQTGAEVISGGIPTSAGDQSTPSGLAKINAWVDEESNNTAKRFYGGDNEGNIWRFDPAAPTAAHLLATATASATERQPITTKPVLLLVDGKAVVIVGTGRYLGENDITDSTQQSIYAIKDPLDTSGWGSIRDNTNFVKHTLTVDGETASISSSPVNWSTKAGWWVDLPNAKERISTSMTAQYTTLVIPTAIPSGDACKSGGSSWLYFLNATHGGIINNVTPAGIRFSDKSILVGVSWVKDTNGNTRLIGQDSNGGLKTLTPPVTGGGGGGTVRRTSWRELVE